ncbi:MAG TPA: hypothetical protein VKZ58_02205 [Longimicrobiales bacterium]|nr:hypothetical protein [Longimicrobiales bacterium]
MSGQAHPAAVGDPVERLRRRIQAYARYASLMHAQIEALDAGDLDRFTSLSEDRRRVAAEVDGDGLTPDGQGAALASGADDPVIGELIRAARRELMKCLEADRQIDERLRRMRKESLDRIRSLDASQHGVQSYVRTEPTRPALDVRF